MLVFGSSADHMHPKMPRGWWQPARAELQAWPKSRVWSHLQADAMPYKAGKCQLSSLFPAYMTQGFSAPLFHALLDRDRKVLPEMLREERVRRNRWMWRQARALLLPAEQLVTQGTKPGNSCAEGSSGPPRGREPGRAPGGRQQHGAHCALGLEHELD